MSFSTWISRRLFSIFESDRCLEEMDKLELETRILEHLEHENTNFSRNLWIFGAGITVAVGTVATVTRRTWIFGVLGGVTVVSGITVAYGRWSLRRKAQEIRRITIQMERTKAALRRRRQVQFSISLQLPTHRNPLISRACRLAVQAIETLSLETTVINETSWTDLYTEEIRGITVWSTVDSEKLAIEELEEVDFEAVFETLISVFKLHASEYSRAVILDFLKNFQFQKFRNFWRTCGRLGEIRKRIGAIESLALSNTRKASENTKNNSKNAKNSENGLEIGWKQQTAMALDAVLEGLQTNSLSPSQVDHALRRTLIVIGSETALKSEQPEENSQKIDRKMAENEGNEEDLVVFVKGERTDVDMVFEGTPLSEADKLASKSACARDVLLDGSESRKHEASLMGELQMVLEPRRNDFEKREKKALAKFYGMKEKEMEVEKEQENEGKNGEETYTGIAIGGDGDQEPEPYDWRKDAETSSGLHQEADNLDFLAALAARSVRDDVLE